MRRDLNQGRTVVGAMLTATNSAYVAGADWQHSWQGRAWTVSGFVAASGT